DVNGDGVSDVSDILTIQSHILGKTVLSGGILLSADCNGDGVSDVSDILTIQSAILGKSAIKPQRF
ncbi:MAG: dockerin type I repeat-containing protein, partial [Acutalibacteraceae bacterium]